MTIPSIRAVGFCVNYSRQGDRAFELALDIARNRQLQLNIFHFLSDPYEPGKNAASDLPDDEVSRLSVEMERKMRLYYDEKLGDYLDVGFRLCEDNEWTELHRCLCKKDFQLLILACPSENAVFGNRSLKNFAEGFVCPVILVGPESRSQLRLNKPALLMDNLIGLNREECIPLEFDKNKQFEQTI